MALFSTLLESSSSASPSNNENGNSSALSSSSIPTVIQLYTSKALVMDDSSGGMGSSTHKDGPSNTNINDASIIVSHAVLSYQACEVGTSLFKEDAKEDGNDALLFGQKRKFTLAPKNLNPNLGIWNCKCTPNRNTAITETTDSDSPAMHSNGNSNLIDRLLSVPSNDSHVFLFTVDLAEPHNVEPTMSLLQEALVRYLIQNNGQTSNDQHAHEFSTTSLHRLSSTQFGLAPLDKKGKVTTVQEEKQLNTASVPLVICAIVPIPDTIQNYKGKQAQALLLYHLRRYAAALKATLVLVDSGQNSSNSNNSSGGEGGTSKKDDADANNSNDQTSSDSNEQPTLPAKQVGIFLRQLALKQQILSSSIDEELHLDSDASTLNPATEDSNNEKEEDKEATAMYRPGVQEDLIESVLLRNAHFPGEWDASKDSLWVAFPPSKSNSNDVDDSKGNKKQSALGDDEWLSQLRESVSSLLTADNKGGSAADTDDASNLAATATKPTRKKMAAKNGDKKGPDVSSFFEDLLKK